jgi:hypothetical protein
VHPTIAEPNRSLSGQPLDEADLLSLNRAQGTIKEFRDCMRHGRCRATRPPKRSLSIGATGSGRRRVPTSVTGHQLTLAAGDCASVSYCSPKMAGTRQWAKSNANLVPDEPTVASASQG